MANDAGLWIGIAAGLTAIEVTVLGVAWRLSAWRTRTESRIAMSERRLDRVERYLGLDEPARHRRRFLG